jgi:hypothetical protein
MSNWRGDIDDCLRDFLDVARLAGEPIALADFRVEFLEAPHAQPGRFPDGAVAVYGFWHAGTWLKIGKAGPQTHARYSYQHYRAGSARSTLAGSLLADGSMSDLLSADSVNVSEWIRSSTNRVNILLPASRGSALLSLLEAFLHVRLKPRYEG